MSAALFIVGVCLGGGVGAYFFRMSRVELLAERQARSAEAMAAMDRESKLNAELSASMAAAATDAQMLDAFKAASAEAFAQQGEQMVTLAAAKYESLQSTTDVVLTKHGTDVTEGLRLLSERLALLEKERSTSVTEMRTMVENLTSQTTATRQQAERLASAMSDNRVRGAWGEVQLRRALELAGLDRHVDFVEQRGVSNGSDTGRPDVIVHLPNGRCIVIDSKVPLGRYLEAVDVTDEVTRRALQVEHAKAVATHVKALAAREYESLVSRSVDLVLLFLPGEPFLSAALDADAALFETAAAKGVFLVTPSSLIPLLRGVALGWREHQAGEAADEVHKLGVELHERIAVFAGHYARVGAQLERTVDAFNSSVGSLDQRVLSTARKLSDRGAKSLKSLPEIPLVEKSTRTLRTASVDDTPMGAIDSSPAAIAVGAWPSEGVPTDWDLTE